jgi:uncharacterized membrane protein YfhO
MPKDFSKPKLPTEVSSFNSINNQNLTLLNYLQKTQNIELIVDAKKITPIIIPLAYFPSWQATVNGEKSKIIENPKGILLKIKTGENRITLNFKETPIEEAANLISIASIVALLAGIIYFRKKHE